MDENEIREIEGQMEPETQAPRRDRDQGIPWAALLVMVWAVALVVFAVQNAEATTIDFLGWSWQMPVALLVMITALVTLVLTAGGSALYRRRRRRRRDVAGER